MIIERIEKLYALASGGALPGEATAAISMAEKLMKKYRINSSEVNKHTYTDGKSQQRRREPRKPPETHTGEYWKKRRDANWSDFTHGEWNKRPPNWEDYEEWSKKQQEEHEGFRREYYRDTFDPVMIRADKIDETNKAILFYVYLDEKMYPWAKVPRITVRVWMPKSQVVTNLGGVWLMNGELLRKNLNNNKEWLREHHPVFKGVKDIEFYFRGAL
jgi:hypothetical protein